MHYYYYYIFFFIYHSSGADFNKTIAKDLCQVCIFARGSRVECDRFTKRGTNLCEKVCHRQDQNILRRSPTTVVLKDSYCTKSQLKPATCVCVFKVMCHEFNHFAFVHFITDRNGEVALQYYEAGHALRKSI